MFFQEVRSRGSTRKFDQEARLDRGAGQGGSTRRFDEPVEPKFDQKPEQGGSTSRLNLRDCTRMLFQAPDLRRSTKRFDQGYRFKDTPGIPSWSTCCRYLRSSGTICRLC